MYDEARGRRVRIRFGFFNPAFFAFGLIFYGCLSFGVSVFAQQRDAVLEYRNGNYAAAVNICKDEIIIDEYNLEAHIVLCWSLLKLGRYPEAVPYAELAERLARYDVRVVEIRGEINYFQGKNMPALHYFQEYINLAPEGQRIDAVYYFMGEIYIRLGRYKHADIALSTALHFDPNSAFWWTRLAYAREMSGEYTESMRAYHKALELNSHLIDANRGLERVRSLVNAR